MDLLFQYVCINSVYKVDRTIKLNVRYVCTYVGINGNLRGRVLVSRMSY
jgi:hypothetical protein